MESMRKSRKSKAFKIDVDFFLRLIPRRNVEVKYYTKRDAAHISDEIGRWLLSCERNFSVFKAVAFDSVVESLVSVD